MNLDDAAWDATTFTKNRDRLVQHEVARHFFEEVVRQAKRAALISSEHFTVDGTLIDAWASLKSFRKKGEKSQDRSPPDDPPKSTVNPLAAQTVAVVWAPLPRSVNVPSQGSSPWPSPFQLPWWPSPARSRSPRSEIVTNL
jgi:hypothetical protein